MVLVMHGRVYTLGTFQMLTYTCLEEDSSYKQKTLPSTCPSTCTRVEYPTAVVPLDMHGTIV